MENLFQKAARNKFRFKTAKGSLNTEQLFELSKSELDELYTSLKAKTQNTEGLLGRKSNTLTEDKMEVVKTVFSTLVEEEERKEDLASRKALKAKVLETIEEKKIGELKGKSLGELQELAKNL